MSASHCLLLLSLGSALQAALWDPELCRTRESHWRYGTHGYVYSGQSKLLQEEEKTSVVTGDREANLTAVTRDWSGAGDWCQARCMDLVSLETEEELGEGEAANTRKPDKCRVISPFTFLFRPITNISCLDPFIQSVLEGCGWSECLRDRKRLVIICCRVL